jgi:hypothetical protein
METWEAPRLTGPLLGTTARAGNNYAWNESGHIRNADNPWDQGNSSNVPPSCADTQNPLGANS